jgi:hypothetical protein
MVTRRQCRGRSTVSTEATADYVEAGPMKETADGREAMLMQTCRRVRIPGSFHQGDMSKGRLQSPQQVELEQAVPFVAAPCMRLKLISH